jgi:hypothetical protein
MTTLLLIFCLSFVLFAVQVFIQIFDYCDEVSDVSTPFSIISAAGQPPQIF